MIFWFRFFRKHSRHALWGKTQYGLLDVTTIHSKCKCGWQSEDHGDTQTGHNSALDEFIWHLQHELNLARS